LVVHDYPTTWENLKQLTQETNSAKQDPWLWVYDNFNMHNKSRHERKG